MVLLLCIAAFGGIIYQNKKALKSNEADVVTIMMETEKVEEETLPENTHKDIMPKLPTSESSKYGIVTKLNTQQDGDYILSEEDADKLNLFINYEVSAEEGGIIVTVETNLPNKTELNVELTNINAVKKDMGLTDKNSDFIKQEQFDEILERTYNKTQRDMVSNSLAYFKFDNPPYGALTIYITMPIIKLQPADVRKALGEHGENLVGNYVIYLKELDNKTIKFTDTFMLEAAADKN